MPVVREAWQVKELGELKVGVEMVAGGEMRVESKGQVPEASYKLRT